MRWCWQQPPVWAGPPSDELPSVVSLGQFFHRGAQLVMAAKSVEVFSTGCLVEVVWSVLRAEESDNEWGRITEQCFNRGPYGLDTGSSRGGALRFGIALSDGRKLTTADLHSAMSEGTVITGPGLTTAGGGGGSGDDNQVSASIKFWLWPLPLAGDTRLVAQWDDLGMKESSVMLTGAQLGTAAARVQKYWLA